MLVILCVWGVVLGVFVFEIFFNKDVMILLLFFVVEEISVLKIKFIIYDD